MSEQEVIDLMSSSTTEDQWNENCAKVKAEFNGYPSFWYMAISGVYIKTSQNWE